LGSLSIERSANFPTLFDLNAPWFEWVERNSSK